MEKLKPKISNKDESEVSKLGGFDPRDLESTKLPENQIACDKGSHKERSIANSTVHIKHWKKTGNIFTRPK